MEPTMASHRFDQQIRRFASFGSFGLVVLAVVQELAKPREDRTWNGRVAGFVPYDFRPPTVARLRERLWSPDGRLVVPQVFGVGWTVNLGRLVRLVKPQR
jgi:hypothetical protein